MEGETGYRKIRSEYDAQSKNKRREQEGKGMKLKKLSDQKEIEHHEQINETESEDH